MEYTDKQVRNGAVGTNGEHNTAVASPDITALVAATQGSASAMSAYTVVAGNPFVESAGVVDWETNVATHDAAGEA
jgi:hypothetical protein